MFQMKHWIQFKTIKDWKIIVQITEEKDDWKGFILMLHWNCLQPTVDVRYMNLKLTVGMDVFIF